MSLPYLALDCKVMVLVTSTSLEYHQLHEDLTRDLHVQSLSRVFTLNSESQTFDSQSQQSFNGIGAIREYNAVFALNLEKFVAHSSIFTEAEIDTNNNDYSWFSSPTEMASVTITPSNTSDVWSFGSFVDDTGGTQTSLGARLQIDDADQPFTQTSDNYDQLVAWGTDDEYTWALQSIESMSAVPHNVDVDFIKFDSTLRAEDRLAFAVVLELAEPTSSDLYVTSSLFDDSVLRYNGTSGQFEAEHVTTGSGGLNDPWGITFDETNDLVYVSSRTTDEVLQYNGNTGQFISVVINSTNGIADPRSLTLDSTNNVYASSTLINEIYRYDTSTQGVSVFVTAGSGGLFSPIGLEFGPDGNLYVLSSALSEVERYDGTTGAHIDTFVTSADNGGLSNGRGLAFGSDGNLYLTSGSNNNVLRFDGTTGAFIDEFVTSGSGGLSIPQGITFDQDGNLYVSSFSTSSVLRYDLGGNFIDEFVSPGSGGLQEPFDLTFGSNP
ncbi:MAG: SMP-30/gluconolactonase/LRE family protein [Nitrosopumilus sp.]|nr:SMP-30/gluconolactonase/LRE family protein [Nitrosopumilus sp.]